eukprot:s2174_g6.t1
MALIAGVPSGVLRPPVAVGPLLDDEPERRRRGEPFYSGVPSPKKSFYGGGWSFPAVQPDDEPFNGSPPESPPPRGDPTSRVSFRGTGGGWSLGPNADLGSEAVAAQPAGISVRTAGLGRSTPPRPLPALPSALSVPSTRVDSFPRQPLDAR